MTPIAKAAQRSPAELLMAVEALALMMFFRICLALVPVRTIVGTFTRRHAAAKIGGVADAADAERVLQAARQVQWAVKGVARHSFVEFVCFPQSLAAYTMLRWRGVASTIVYGVARSPEGDLIAHTWLETGDGIVTGGEESVGFTAVDRWS
jgi:hypothetical protein